MKPNPTNKDIRRFGLAALLVFGALCAVALWQAKPALGVFFAAPGLLGLGLLLLPGPMAPVYHGWLTVAHFTGTALTIVMLTVFYFLVMTPTAWLKRLFGGRPLPVKPDPGASSYWVPRREPAQPKERFYKRY